MQSWYIVSQDIYELIYLSQNIDVKVSSWKTYKISSLDDQSPDAEVFRSHVIVNTDRCGRSADENCGQRKIAPDRPIMCFKFYPVKIVSTGQQRDLPVRGAGYEPSARQESQIISSSADWKKPILRVATHWSPSRWPPLEAHSRVAELWSLLRRPHPSFINQRHTFVNWMWG